MHENLIARNIVDAAYQSHRRTGPGLLESFYQAAMVIELKRKGLRCQAEVPVPASYDHTALGVAFRADLIVEEVVLVEIKATTSTAAVHRRQVLTYLRVTDLRLGLLINFGFPTIKQGLARIVNNLPE
jgi:GxxExxY protein